MINQDETQFGSDVITYYNSSGDVTSSAQVPVISYKLFCNIDLSVEGSDRYAPNPYAYRVREYQYPRGKIEELYIPGGYRTQVEDGALGPGALDVGPAFAEQIPDNESRNYNAALSKLNDKVRGGLDLSTSVIEYRQTQKMLAGAGKISSFLGNTINEFERRWNQLPPGTKNSIIGRRLHTAQNAAQGFRDLLRTVPVRTLMKDLGGNWLQFHLGLEPLLNDFHGIVKEVYTGVIPKVLRKGAKVYTPIAVTGIDSSRSYSSVIHANVLGVQGVEIHCQFRPPDQVNLSRWTTLSPLSVAYELMTLSFVIDYVYNIGNMLRDAETAILYETTFDSGYITYLRAYNGLFDGSGIWKFTSAYHYRVDFAGSVRHIDFRREVLGGWPIPRLPVFKPKLGAIQLLTVASLLAARLSGRR
jgi:hypothetical protein